MAKKEGKVVIVDYIASSLGMRLVNKIYQDKKLAIIKENLDSVQ